MRSSPTPRCRAFLERLPTYVEGDLSGPARQTVTRHLRRCPSCHELAASLHRTVVLCRQAGTRRLPAAVRARARARIATLLAEQPAGHEGR